MKMIEKFLKIKNFRIFGDFSWPENLLPFSRYNVFYAWNGAGKTTLSTLFSFLERRTPFTEGEVALKIGKETFDGAQFDSSSIPAVRVFNREFADKTLQAIGEANAQPIYYLGADNVEKADELKRARGRAAEIDRQLEEAKNQLIVVKAETERFASMHARHVKELVLGSSRYQNYDRRRYLEQVGDLRQREEPLRVLGKAEKMELERVRHVQERPPVSPSPQPEIHLSELETKIKAFLPKTVVSAVLSRLADDPELARWVQTGLRLHSGERESSRCRFCGHDFSESTRKKYEAHFNDEYGRFQSDLGALLAELNQSEALLHAPFPSAELLYEHLHADYQGALRQFDLEREQLCRALGRLRDKLEEKRDKPFAAVPFAEEGTGGEDSLPPISSLESSLGGTWQELNGIIKDHNAYSGQIQQQRQDACSRLVENYVLSTLKEYDALESKRKDWEENCRLLLRDKAVLDEQISTLERALVESRRPVAELNDELRSYLGREELAFELSGSGYRLVRGTHPADNLSEGERTAISLLYFLKTLADKGFELEKSIIVIDDPIASLDEGALFTAFSYIKDRVANCGQLFLLTHNFQFFRQVKNWISYHGPRGRFYGLESKCHDGCRATSIVVLDPLLVKFESEYHFLFKKIHDIATVPTNDGLSAYYGIPNMGRRVLEAFLAHHSPNVRGNLHQALSGIQFDGAKKTLILRYLNTYSHSATIGGESDPSCLAETSAVLRALLELIEHADPQHYAGMMALIGNSSGNEA